MNEPLQPVLLGPKNCEAATGLTWRHVREHAVQLGVGTIRVGKKTVVDAAAFLAALKSRGADNEQEQLESLRKAVGLR